MFVCSCHAVTDRRVRAAIDEGATTIKEIGAQCLAGTSCQGCWPQLEALLDEAGVHRSGWPERVLTALTGRAR